MAARKRVTKTARVDVELRYVKKLRDHVSKNSIQPPIPDEIQPVTGIFQNARQGVCEITVDNLTAKEAAMVNLRQAFQGQPDRLSVPGPFTRLTINGELMMTDVPFERRTNIEIVREAHGDVLVAGLGLGMILMSIVPKPSVTRVLVIEKYKDVVDIVEPRIREALGIHGDKLAVLIDDVLTMEMPKRGSPSADGFMFDTIYFDIWPTVDAANQAEITRLKRRFRPFLKKVPDAHMSAWVEAQVQMLNRQKVSPAQKLINEARALGLLDDPS